MQPDTIWQILGILIALIIAVLAMILPPIPKYAGWLTVVACVILAGVCIYALVTGKNLQEVLPDWLPWQSIVAFFIGGAILSGIYGVFFSDGFSPVENIPTEIVLEFHADGTPPLQLSEKNSYRWYSLNYDISNPTNGQIINRIVTLVWVFNRPTYFKQLEVRPSQGVNIPQYEMKDSNVRYALITFMGPMPNGVVEFRLKQ